MKVPNHFNGETEVFELITGRKPKVEDMRIMGVIATKLKIEFNDAFWVAMEVMQAYSSILTELPRKIDDSADDLMKSAREAARIHGELVKAQVDAKEVSATGAPGGLIGENKRSMRRGFLPTAQVAHPRETWNKPAKLLLIFMGALLVGAAGGYWAGNRYGEQRGFKAGYSYLIDERAAYAWSSTQQGQIAYQMSRSGVLDMLINCAGKGWSVTNGVCTPLKVPGEGTYGWPMPRSPVIRN